MAIAAGGVLSQGPVLANLGWYGFGGQVRAWLLALTAPVFSAWALINKTGINISQEKYDKLYGDRKDYQKWRSNTPMLVPKVF